MTAPPRSPRPPTSNGTTLREEAIGDGIPAEDFDAIVRPEDMLGPK